MGDSAIISFLSYSEFISSIFIRGTTLQFLKEWFSSPNRNLSADNFSSILLWEFVTILFIDI